MAFIQCSALNLSLSSFLFLPKPSTPSSFPHSEDSFASSFWNAAELFILHFLGTGYKLSTVQETTPHRHSLC